MAQEDARRGEWWTPRGGRQGVTLSVTGAARKPQQQKQNRYRNTTAQHHAELLPLGVETYGGMTRMP